MHTTTGLKLLNSKTSTYAFAPQERHFPPDSSFLWTLTYSPSYLLCPHSCLSTPLSALLLLTPMAGDLDQDASASWPHNISTKHYPCSPSLASTASSSSSSVFSLEASSSQSSDSSSTGWSSSVWHSENENENPYSTSRHISRQNLTSSSDEEVIITSYLPSSQAQPHSPAEAVAPESRQNPRRTQRLNSYESHDGKIVSSCPRPPPSLVRQSERKENFVDSLVGKLTCWIS